MRHGDTVVASAASNLMAPHTRRRSLVALLPYLACVGCATTHPTAQVVATAQQRIVISADVPDWTRLCVQPTAPMLVAEPTLDAAICRFTVGDVRWLTTLRRPAN